LLSRRPFNAELRVSVLRHVISAVGLLPFDNG